MYKYPSITSEMHSLWAGAMLESALNELKRSGHLTSVFGESLIVKEQQALRRLRQRPVQTFLSSYDILFRLVSLKLLERGFALTDYQPHQALARVCALFEEPRRVKEVIRCRHDLKYESLQPTSLAVDALASLTLAFATPSPFNTINHYSQRPA